ncbi:uncharacterized protein LOC131162218 isoform X2 [Malania oleifera]|uniref:uncharacterized protein LOC131162218 isoform X2 n=1 Tax=Malania oleifera TaxID=397392 RepID=UPI0025AECC33|nr:uncharacterized protein LOC131162218 isoform X2 [Malania oleifera]
MTSATLRTNPKPKNRKNVHYIGGIPVDFPYEPYGSQLAFMGRVIFTLDRAQRDGHCHALLESPTGTGKTLSLLCSVLAWQENHRSKNLSANLAQSKPNPEALSDPHAHGGGFIPETQSSTAEIMEPASSATNNKTKKKKMAPTIFYASRTHSQITQVIREYRKTTYRVPMAVLASRKHYCTNARVRANENIDEECKLLLKNGEVGCPEFKNVKQIRAHPSLQKGGCHEAHDIEDLVKVGQVVKGCSYFAACSMAEDAQLVFCPYSYIVNPIVRRAMDIDIEGAIVVLDEAHNIEDMARDSGSVDIEEDVLHELQMELQQLCSTDVLVYQPLYEMTQEIRSWMERRKSSLEKREFQHYFSCWTGDKALKELQEANISQQYFLILQECVKKAIRDASDTELSLPHLSGPSVTTLEGLFSSLSYFFSGNGLHIYDYQLVLRHYVKRDAGNCSGSWMYTFSLWCLNPAVVFKGIADITRSMILTSGTLSPMNSFSSELGVQFGTCLEAPHVIEPESQLWAATIPTGAGNYPLNASYKTADGFAFQDALGTSLEEICKIVPGGALVFFPSYKLMEKLCNRWRETGQWSRLNAQKSFFVEPRGGSQDDFDSTLKCYYDCIRRGNKPPLGRKRREKKMILNYFGAKESIKSSEEGAAFLAVCRGKVSEGIDFSDENARVVIVVGIPFPNINDIQVAQKKKYNDMYKSSKNLLSGNEWYCHQAFRALNQAVGRCIRHRFDYGAVILLDERFREERNTTYISKWLRKSIRQYDSFDMSLEGLKSFFRDVKERGGTKTINVLHGSDNNVENFFSMGSKGSTRRKNQKLSKSSNLVKKAALDHGRELEKPAQADDTVEACVLIDEDNSICREYIDVETDIKKDSRCSKAINKEFLSESTEIYIVKETPGMDCNIPMTSPQSLCKDENSTNQASTDFPDQLFCSMSFTSPSGPPSKEAMQQFATPERNVTEITMPEIESSLNLSVNSHAQKRRKFIRSPLVNLIQLEQSDSPETKTSGLVSHMGSLMSSKDADNGNEFGSKHIFKKSTAPLSFMVNNSVSCLSSGLDMNKRLKLFCALCRNPLGLYEDNYVKCSLTSISKVHLASLLKGSMEAPTVHTSTGVPIVVSEISSVNKRLCDRTLEDAPGQGIWCEEDGCVFSTIFCPFCTTRKYCLGVQVLATDASNIQLLNKVLFYIDRLQIKNPEAPKDEDLPACCSDLGETAVLNSFEKFSCTPCQGSGGWRTTKSKLRLPKRGLLSVSDSKCGLQTALDVDT